MTCRLCLEYAPFATIADHMRLIHPDLVWHGDDPGDARADAWPDGKAVVYEDAEALFG